MAQPELGWRSECSQRRCADWREHLPVPAHLRRRMRRAVEAVGAGAFAFAGMRCEVAFGAALHQWRIELLPD